MSAPPGFNPNASLLPDPGPSAAPIQVMKGGGSSTAQKGGVGAFNNSEMAALAKYQLHSDKDGNPVGVIAAQFNDEQKREFLNQIADKSRCRRTTGDSIILSKDCWAVVKVIRALLNAKIKKGNLETPSPAPEPPSVPSDPGQQPSVTDVSGEVTNEDIAGLSEPGGPGGPAGEPAAGPGGEPSAGPDAGTGNQPAATNNNSNLTNENVSNIHNYDEESEASKKLSPCKNRKSLQTNAANSGSVGSLNETERAELNTAVTARGGNNASAAAPSAVNSPVKRPLARQNASRSLVNTRKKKKGVLFRTTEGLKRTNENRLPEEKNIAFSEGDINVSPNAKNARGARNYFTENPDYFSSTAENVAEREQKAKSTARRRQIKNINQAIKTKKNRLQRAFEQGLNVKREENAVPNAVAFHEAEVANS